MHACVVQAKRFGTDDWDALQLAHPFPGRSKRSLTTKWRYIVMGLPFELDGMEWRALPWANSHSVCLYLCKEWLACKILICTPQRVNIDMKYSDNKNYDRKLKLRSGEEIPKLAHRPWTWMEETELLRAVWRRDNGACYMRHSQTTS